MKIFLILALTGVALARESPLKAVLRSPKETLELYNNFKAEQHLKFDPKEEVLRFRLFRQNAELVADENSVDGETAEFALNFFSTLTPEEASSYRGLNVSGHEPNDEPELTLESGNVATPASKLWTDEGLVTTVKNQGSCGSCWTYGAVGGLETRYAKVARVLRNFAEQEYLDCVYEGQRDGCRGGWPNNCYEYSKYSGGRLAKTADYGYTARDGSCRSSSKPDAMIAAKITGYVAVPSSEAANIQALATGALSVAFEVTNRFQTYSNGIIRDRTCRGRVNHAVTAVGYTANYVLVKNSWGSSWGDQGFVRFGRNYANCGLFQYSSYPILEGTGRADTGGSDAAVNYTPTDGDVAPACEDRSIYCLSLHCLFPQYIKWCRATCGRCEDANPDGECPSGTIKCSDGVCRHEHMC